MVESRQCFWSSLLLWLDSKALYQTVFRHWTYSVCLADPSSDVSVCQCQFYKFLQSATIFWSVWWHGHILDYSTWFATLLGWCNLEFFPIPMVPTRQRIGREPTLLFSEDQASSTMASQRSYYPSCWSWTSEIDDFLSKAIFSRRLEYMEWSRAFSSFAYFLWRSATENSGINALIVTKEI